MRVPTQSPGVVRRAPGSPRPTGITPSIIWGVVIGATVVFTFGPDVIDVVVDELGGGDSIVDGVREGGDLGDYPVPEPGGDRPV